MEGSCKQNNRNLISLHREFKVGNQNFCILLKLVRWTESLGKIISSWGAKFAEIKNKFLSLLHIDTCGSDFPRKYLNFIPIQFKCFQHFQSIKGKPRVFQHIIYVTRHETRNTPWNIPIISVFQRRQENVSTTMNTFKHTFSLSFFWQLKINNVGRWFLCAILLVWNAKQNDIKTMR